jgi:hypothetical protein
VQQRQVPDEKRDGPSEAPSEACRGGDGAVDAARAPVGGDGHGRTVSGRVGVQVPHGHAARDDEPVVVGHVPRHAAGNERLIQFRGGDSVQAMTDLFRRSSPNCHPGGIFIWWIFGSNPDHSGAEVHDVRLDAVGDAVGGVEPERVLAHYYVGIRPAAAQELLETLGKGSSPDVNHRLRRVGFGKRLTVQ